MKDIKTEVCDETGKVLGVQFHDQDFHFIAMKDFGTGEWWGQPTDSQRRRARPSLLQRLRRRWDL